MAFYRLVNVQTRVFVKILSKVVCADIDIGNELVICKKNRKEIDFLVAVTPKNDRRPSERRCENEIFSPLYFSTYVES